ncbi:uncharacterized protein CDAR_184291 [Caerostris darwini]|uniref:Uncharacterized protein n=1 Tax=Caerostris darwini TaxID=1538125 RepID=A0AAV4UFU9_9ARAC|nr:uncharacterized protein CDAR_184291 [Caerostris darwini]
MHNVSYTDISEKDTLQKRFPYLRLEERDHPWLDDDGAGYINPRNMVEAQKKVSELQGCHIIDDIAEEVKDAADGVHMIVTEQGKL